MNPTTHATEVSASAPVLSMAPELSNRSWRLAFGDPAARHQAEHRQQRREDQFQRSTFSPRLRDRSARACR